MPEPLWKQAKQCMPIPCLDVILENAHGEILVGWRRILPYRDVWALPGGRLLKGEGIKAAAARILAEYCLSVRDLFLVGVFPIRFPSRSDVPVCVAGRIAGGKAKPDGKEFSSFRWTSRLPVDLGTNYRRMIERWCHMKRYPKLMRLCGL
jgi:ADP-ribose pyrophosphatase YjhB (NUDIX family)